MNSPTNTPEEMVVLVVQNKNGQGAHNEEEDFYECQDKIEKRLKVGDDGLGALSQVVIELEDNDTGSENDNGDALVLCDAEETGVWIDPKTQQFHNERGEVIEVVGVAKPVNSSSRAGTVNEGASLFGVKLNSKVEIPPDEEEVCPFFFVSFFFFSFAKKSDLKKIKTRFL